VDYQVSVVSRDDTVEPLSLDAAKRDLDVTFADDDELIQEHIDSAIGYAEAYTNLFLVPVTLRLYTGSLPSIFRLPRGPVQGVTSVLVDGVAVAGFQTISGSSYAVLPPVSQSWPFTATPYGSVIEYSAGFAAGKVPPAILGALKQIVSIYYDKPSGNELASQWAAVERVLSPLKLRSV
jgi:hypothetical protein